MSSTSSSSHWHVVTPQTRPLTLTILELTPLALTLSLTLAPLPSSPPYGRLPTQHVVHSQNHTLGPSKYWKKTRHRRPESDDELTAVDADDDSSSPLPGTYPVSGLFEGGTNFKDLLSHGVVVSVNGQPWSRIVAHVSDLDDEDAGESEAVEGGEEGEWEDESDHAVEGGMEEGMTRRPRKARFSLSAGDAVRSAASGEGGGERRRKRTEKDKGKWEKDRAVVVVYGLSPAKEYEVELRVVGPSGQDRELLVSNSVLIPPSLSPNAGLHPRSRANSLRSRSHPRSRSNSVNTSHPAHQNQSSQQDHSAYSSGGTTPPSANGMADPHIAAVLTNILNPADTQAAQIRHLIAAAHAEKDRLQSQIKEARRASQRAEAALRAEIESVKKVIHKAGTLDRRAKQKALALQEQVKQGWAGAEAADKETTAVEAGMGSLENRLEGLKVEVETVRGEWKVAKEREDDIREREKKDRAEEEKKLAEVAGKVDKLRVRKEKKEAEKAELEKRLEELTKQKEEAEKRNEEEKAARGSSGYYPLRWDEYGHEGHNRSLSSHPSLNNLSGHNQYAAGPGHRPRGGAGGVQPRFPSAGSVRPNPTQSSPTHPNSFFSLQHPVPPSNTSPAFRPPKPVSASPATNPRGVNVAAIPFHPSTSYGSSSQGYEHTTSFMPPQLQHRIYLPNVRPHPTPNFHPPPSVLAEQAQATKRTSPPAFPPLPGQSQSSLIQPGGKSGVPAGPSLASIVTKAVLSPTSALANQAIVPSSSGTRPSPPPGSTRSPPQVASSLQTNLTTSTSFTTNPVTSPIPAAITALGQRATFASPTHDFPPLSPTGPWGTMSHGSGSSSSTSGAIEPGYSESGAIGGAGGFGFNIVRTATPPVSW